MRKRKITNEQIREEIVSIFQKSRMHIQGSIPQTVSDLPSKFTNPSWKSRTKNEFGEYSTRTVKNVYWKKAYSNIANRNRKHYNHPPATAKAAPTPHRVEATPDNSITITIPSSMAYGKVMDLIAIIRKAGVKCNL